MSKYCDDCGSKLYNGHCPNCDEEVFIAEQERENEMDAHTVYKMTIHKIFVGGRPFDLDKPYTLITRKELVE